MTEAELESMRLFAIELAALAHFIVSTAGSGFAVHAKTDASEVTCVDRRIQRALARRIAREFPGHAVVAEERDEWLDAMPDPAAAKYCWVVDPLDGTRNFTRGLPIYSTSIGLLDDGCPVVGVVRDLVNGMTWSARHGGGALLGDCAIGASDRAWGDRTLITFQPAADGTTYNQARDILPRVHTRNTGSTALHLAHLAAGCVDGCICIENRLWDIAAGYVLLTEAGARLTDCAGKAIFPLAIDSDLRRPMAFVAGTNAVHGELVARFDAGIGNDR